MLCFRSWDKGQVRRASEKKKKKISEIKKIGVSAPCGTLGVKRTKISRCLEIGRLCAKW